jgi:hypothetical protein
MYVVFGISNPRRRDLVLGRNIGLAETLPVI